MKPPAAVFLDGGGGYYISKANKPPAFYSNIPFMAATKNAADGGARAENLEDAEFATLRARAPEEIFAEWFAAAQQSGVSQPEAMTLATAANGAPQARTVLLKDFSGGEFVFFTNRESRKGLALRANPRAALLFFWQSLGRQIKIEGNAAELSRAQTEAYFRTRPRQSQIGAWTSHQSRPVESPAAFTQKIVAAQQQFSQTPPPLPPAWSGYKITPLRMEFWREGEFRLHRRLAFWRAAPEETWQSAFLQP